VEDDCERIGFENYRKSQGNKGQPETVEHKKVEVVGVYRIGRYWQCWAAYDCQLLKIESEDYHCAEKRNEEYRKKYVLE
jgi:hypothetical protein